jgi:hypothetical protein
MIFRICLAMEGKRWWETYDTESTTWNPEIEKPVDEHGVKRFGETMVDRWNLSARQGTPKRKLLFVEVPE